jgi:hypothetical protein
MKDWGHGRLTSSLSLATCDELWSNFITKILPPHVHALCGCVGVFLFNWRGGMHAVESLFARCCEFFYQYLGVELQDHWNYLDVELHHWNHDIIDVLLLNCCCGVFTTISLMRNHVILLTRTQSCSVDLHYITDIIMSYI